MSYPVRTLTQEWIQNRCIAEPNSGCWLWTGSVRHHGYGKVLHDGKWKLAHRISWIVYRGDIPDGLFVLHRCDMPICVNPNHLFLGTNTDNMRDMQLKMRHPVTRLTAEDVEEIRASLESQYVIAERFSISQGHVSGIKSGYRWNRSEWL